jgi:hypothetical protein
VVGRLAQQHGIKVQLRRSWYGGVTAQVLVPQTLLQVDGSLRGRVEPAWPPSRLTKRGGWYRPLSGQAGGDQPPGVQAAPPGSVAGDSTGPDVESPARQATVAGAARPPTGVRKLLARFQTNQGDPRAPAVGQDDAPARSSRGKHGAAS